MLKAAIIGDTQIPYHDHRAFAVATEIIAAEKVDVLFINGDWADFRDISRYPLLNQRTDLSTLRQEVKRSREQLHTFIRDTKPKKVKFTSGNHEWRVVRCFEKLPNALKLLEIEAVGEALSIETLFQFNKLKVPIQFAGQYPNGLWLHDNLEPGQNVWVEHGYTVRKKAGYTATNLMEERMCSVIVNHCEKLAGPIWKRALGKDFFAIENGNLSLIAEPGLGEGIYSGVPHGVPQYMNHRQGFSIVYYDGGQWWPFTVKVRDGKACWNGKLWKA